MLSLEDSDSDPHWMPSSTDPRALAAGRLLKLGARVVGEMDLKIVVRLVDWAGGLGWTVKERW